MSQTAYNSQNQARFHLLFTVIPGFSGGFLLIRAFCKQFYPSGMSILTMPG